MKEKSEVMAMDKQYIAGVDGCKLGWFYVLMDANSDELEFAVIDKIESLVQKPHVDRIWVDMAIGLTDAQHGRQCEALARKMLRNAGVSRASSVFNPPSRQALYCDSYEQANALNKNIVSKGLSKQAWFIVPKMREIDVLLQTKPQFRQALSECHPEIAFTALNNGMPMQFNKKTRAGFDERLQILQHYYPTAEQVITAATQTYRRKDVAIDDIVDAFIIAIAAKNSGNNVSSLPEHMEYDETGIAMRMLYWNGTEYD